MNIKALVASFYASFKFFFLIYWFDFLGGFFLLLLFLQLFHSQKVLRGEKIGFLQLSFQSYQGKITLITDYHQQPENQNM